LPNGWKARTMKLWPCLCEEKDEADGTPLDDFEGAAEIAWRMKIVLPTSPFAERWSLWIISLVVYSSITIPLQFGFGFSNPAGLVAWDIIVDLFFIADIILNFRMAYVRADGTLELTPKLIAIRYAKTWFPLDLVASIPFDLFLIGTSGSEAFGAAKMPRLFRLFRLMKKFDQFASARAFRVINVLVLFLLGAHWVGCLWWFVGYNWSGQAGWQFQPRIVNLLLEVDSDEVERTYYEAGLYHNKTALSCIMPGAVVLPHMDCGVLFEQLPTIFEISLARCYLTSVYWSLTMVMKSPWFAPGTPSEQVYASLILVLSVLFFSIIIGTVNAMINSYDKNNAAFHNNMSSLHKLFRAKMVSHDMRRTLANYQVEYWYNSKGMDDSAIFAEMPTHLRPFVVVEVYKDLIDNTAFLRECSFMGCVDLLLRLRPEVCTKGDRLVMVGSIPESMYILEQGELQILWPTFKGLLTKVQEMLGEEALVSGSNSKRKQSSRVPQGRIDRTGSLIAFQPPFASPTPLKYTVRATQRSTLLSISPAGLRAVLDAHPYDAPTYAKAMAHAAKVLDPDKRGSLGANASTGDIIRTGEVIDDGADSRKTKTKSRKTTDGDASALDQAKADGWLPVACGQRRTSPSSPRASRSTRCGCRSARRARRFCRAR